MTVRIILSLALTSSMMISTAHAQTDDQKQAKQAVEISGTTDAQVTTQPTTGAYVVAASPTTGNAASAQMPAVPTQEKTKARFDPMQFTLGPDDTVEISVMRHPEFSGSYPINQEGKLQIIRFLFQ